MSGDIPERCPRRHRIRLASLGSASVIPIGDPAADLNLGSFDDPARRAAQRDPYGVIGHCVGTSEEIPLLAALTETEPETVKTPPEQGFHVVGGDGIEPPTPCV